MKELLNTESALEEINKSSFVLLYFFSNRCSVCKGLKSKLNEMLLCYPNIKTFSINVEKTLDVASKFSIFASPMILFFIDGKEVIRESKFVNMIKFKNRIDRYYNMYFNSEEAD